jgi:hypothetical protein
MCCPMLPLFSCQHQLWCDLQWKLKQEVQIDLLTAVFSQHTVYYSCTPISTLLSRNPAVLQMPGNKHSLRCSRQIAAMFGTYEINFLRSNNVRHKVLQFCQFCIAWTCTKVALSQFLAIFWRMLSQFGSFASVGSISRGTCGLATCGCSN